MTDHEAPMVVVGAGLVGCVWARHLARRGYRVEVYEKRSDPRRQAPPPGRSTHLVVSARGWKALEAAGAREVVQPIAIPLRGRRIHAQDGGVAFQPYGEGDQSISAVKRDLLNRVLVQLCADTPGCTLHFDQRCTGVEPKTGALTFESQATGARSTLTADRIFAADGAFSAIRAALMRQERFNYSQEYMRYGYKEFTLPAAESRALAADAMHAWPRRELSLFAFPNVDGTFTATLVAPFEGESSFEQLRTPADLEHLFHRLFPDVATAPVVEDFFKHPVSSLVTIRCAPWTCAERVALIGDAAHAMLPFLGQGMNAGFEDCSVLGALLDAHGEQWGRVLREYERLRKPNCDAVTDLSTRNFTELTDRVGDPRFLLQKKLEHKIHRLYPTRFIPMYVMVAFTHIPYTEVQRLAAAQEALVQQLMAFPEIAQAWDSPEVEARIHSLMRDYPAALPALPPG